MRTLVSTLVATSLIAGGAFAQVPAATTATGSNIYTKDGGTVSTAAPAIAEPVIAPAPAPAPAPRYTADVTKKGHGKKAVKTTAKKKKAAVHKKKSAKARVVKKTGSAPEATAPAGR